MTYTKYLMRVQYRDGTFSVTEKLAQHMTYSEACEWFHHFTTGLNMNELGIKYVTLVGECDGMAYPIRATSILLPR